MLAHTEKSILLAGDCDTSPAVAKLLLDHTPFWSARFQDEINLYRSFTASPPPIRTPRLIAADVRRHVLL
ncbi:aminoglycoside phosphotransferase family protein, partial [Streptomyces durbertensis]|nr:aminoglycoside phosphotransferase family protein [Streptomyces durbertensis]